MPREITDKKINRLHSQILFNINQSKDNKIRYIEITKILQTFEDIINQTIKRFVKEEIKATINKKAQINYRTKKLNNIKEAKLVKITYDGALKGGSKSALQLMANKLIKLNIMNFIAKEEIKQNLKK